MYLGGKLLDELHGREGEDGYFPEDWLASVVKALNPPREGKPEHEGLSEVLMQDGSTSFLRELVSEPFPVLTKFLDSAVRLPIQVHPDKATARRMFQSDYGKTEAWYILGGRAIDGEEPYLLMGFKSDVTAESLKSLFDRQDVEGMAAVMHKIPARPGEVYLIRGGMPHAIGPGVLLLEIQEPTDYTISLERTFMGEVVPDDQLHLGLGFGKMFECFHYEKQSLEGLLQSCRLGAKAIEDGYSELIGYEDTPCFKLCRRTIDGAVQIEGGKGPYALVVTRGEGSIDGLAVRQGNCLFVPAGQEAYQIAGEMEVLECWPPRGESA